MGGLYNMGGPNMQMNRCAPEPNPRSAETPPFSHRTLQSCRRRAVPVAASG